jgi:hypothetical protein
VNLYSFLVNAYNSFLGIFPPELQWVVTLVIVIGFVGAFFSIIRHNVIAIVIMIVLLPFLIPVFARFLADIYHFFLYLLQVLHLIAPKG